MKNETHNPVFKHGDRVRITKGFYRTKKGTVIDYNVNNQGDVVSYDVRFGWSWFGLNESYVRVAFSDLELA